MTQADGDHNLEFESERHFSQSQDGGFAPPDDDDGEYGEEDEQGTSGQGLYKQGRGTLGFDERTDSSTNTQSGMTRRRPVDTGAGGLACCGTNTEGKGRCTIF